MIGLEGSFVTLISNTVRVREKLTLHLLIGTHDALVCCLTGTHG